MKCGRVRRPVGDGGSRRRRRIIYKMQCKTLLTGELLDQYLDLISSTKLESIFSNIEGTVLPKIVWEANARCSLLQSS